MIKRGLSIAHGIQKLVIAVAVTTSWTVADATEKNGFDLSGSLVPVSEIRKGGPPRDGIPALDNPRFIGGKAATYLLPDDRVLGLHIDGVARAYPVKILNYHEIVNDRIGTQAVAITYCPLCGSGMVFSAETGNRILDFGVSGLLFNSDVLLFDRQTESLWSQLRREAVTGEMKGRKLEPLPVTHTTWRDWFGRHPDTTVLSDETGHVRNYDVDPYPSYGRDGRLYFPVAAEDPRYPRKAIVMGLEIDGHFKAYPFPELAGGPTRFADTFRGVDLEIRYDEQNSTAAVYGGDGQEIPTVLAFWFAWYAFHPETDVWTR